MRCSLIILLLAALCLGLSACPQQHKSFGGSSGSGNASSKDLPSGTGAYIDVGGGWTSSGPQLCDTAMEIVWAGTSGHYETKSRYPGQSISVSAAHVRFCIINSVELADWETVSSCYRLDLAGDWYMRDWNKRIPVKTRSLDGGKTFVAEMNLPSNGGYVLTVGLWKVNMLY